MQMVRPFWDIMHQRVKREIWTILNARPEQPTCMGSLRNFDQKNYSNDADIDADKSRYKNANPNTSFQGSNNSVSFK